MRYLGGKHRLVKYIVPVLDEYAISTASYVEPFIGGGSIFSAVTHNDKIAGDIHEDLILMWQAILDGWIPPRVVTEIEYKELQKATIASPLRGFVGFACSYGAKWFGGYARGRLDKYRWRNFANEGVNNLIKQRDRLLKSRVTFSHGDYRQFSNVINSLIYCDPPYRNMHRIGGSFNHTNFWNWVRNMSKNNIVIVSECQAPEDFKAILQMKVSVGFGIDGLGNNEKYNRYERLYRLK